jgi:hypothetical protein
MKSSALFKSNGFITFTEIDNMVRIEIHMRKLQLYHEYTFYIICVRCGFYRYSEYLTTLKSNYKGNIDFSFYYDINLNSMKKINIYKNNIYMDSAKIKVTD